MGTSKANRKLLPPLLIKKDVDIISHWTHSYDFESITYRGYSRSDMQTKAVLRCSSINSFFFFFIFLSVFFFIFFFFFFFLLSCRVYFFWCFFLILSRICSVQMSFHCWTLL